MQWNADGPRGSRPCVAAFPVLMTQLPPRRRAGATRGVAAADLYGRRRKKTWYMSRKQSLASFKKKVHACWRSK